MFDQYRTKDKHAIHYSAVFFFRRFLMIIVLITLPSERNIQIVTHMWSTLYIMNYTAFYCPYSRKISNVQEVINEWTVLLASYHLLTFTEWVYDLELRYQLGWSVIATIILNVLFNASIMVSYLLKTCYVKLRKRYLLKQRAKKIELYHKARGQKRAHMLV